MSSQAVPVARPAMSGPAIAGVLAALTTAVTLIAYKASASLGALAQARATGALAPKVAWIDVSTLPAAIQPLAGAVNYFAWVFIALGFGIVLGAAVKAVVPRRWLAATVGAAGARGQLVAALVGAPLMLCSCCVAPIFEGVFARTRRLGPSLALLLASPALNPAALVLTFALFAPRLALARLVLSVGLALVATALLGRRYAHESDAEPEACALELGDAGWGVLGRSLLRALGEGASRSLPAIALGVLLSVLLIGVLPAPGTAGGGTALLTVIVVAALAVPIALPTFAEIPLALALLHAGAPEGAALALLVAGPAINLPSLLTVGRVVSARVALAAAVLIFGVVAASSAVFELLV